MMPEVKERIPDTSEAEKWLTDEVFVCKGRLYKLWPNFKITLYEDWEGDTSPRREEIREFLAARQKHIREVYTYGKPCQK